MRTVLVVVALSVVCGCAVPDHHLPRHIASTAQPPNQEQIASVDSLASVETAPSDWTGRYEGTAEMTGQGQAVGPQSVPTVVMVTQENTGVLDILVVFRTRDGGRSFQLEIPIDSEPLGRVITGVKTRDLEDQMEYHLRLLSEGIEGKIREKNVARGGITGPNWREYSFHARRVAPRGATGTGVFR